MVSFIGWPDQVAADVRIQRLESFMKSTFPGHAISNVGNFYSGPRNDRKLNKASFVEFPSSEAATKFLNE
eukprot:12430664-Karenia_brevis.AAC.1